LLGPAFKEAHEPVFPFFGFQIQTDLLHMHQNLQVLSLAQGSMNIQNREQGLAHLHMAQSQLYEQHRA